MLPQTLLRLKAMLSKESTKDMGLGEIQNDKLRVRTTLECAPERYAAQSGCIRIWLGSTNQFDSP